MERTCIHCGQPGGTGKRELRPYGPNGADVCAGCVLGNPEREQVARKRLDLSLAAAGTLLLDPNEQAGPRPMSEREARKYKRTSQPKKGGG